VAPIRAASIPDFSCIPIQKVDAIALFHAAYCRWPDQGIAKRPARFNDRILTVLAPTPTTFSPYKWLAWLPGKAIFIRTLYDATRAVEVPGAIKEIRQNLGLDSDAEQVNAAQMKGKISLRLIPAGNQPEAPGRSIKP
jgi:hypothetical protein